MNINSTINLTTPTEIMDLIGDKLDVSLDNATQEILSLKQLIEVEIDDLIIKHKKQI